MRAIINGKIYTMAGQILDGGTILVEAGKIKAVGADLAVPAEAEVIDAQGKYVLPGIIDAHTHIGIFEQGIGFEGADGNERTNPATPHLRALDAINPQDKAFAGARAGGVTSLAVAPGSANVIGGQVLAMKTWGQVVDDMVIQEPLGLKIAFGENPKRVYSEQKKSPSTRMAVAAILRENLVAARNYMDKLEKAKDDPEKKPDRDLKLKSWSRSSRRKSSGPMPIGPMTSPPPSASPKSLTSISVSNTAPRGTSSPTSWRKRASPPSSVPPWAAAPRSSSSTPPSRPLEYCTRPGLK